MKLTIKRHSFLKTLAQVAEGIPARSADPNYMNFLLTISGEEQTILASDGVITIRGQLQDEEDQNAIIEFEPGSIEIPAKYLLDIIRQLEGDIVTLSQVESSVLNITDGTSNFNINTVRGEEYPSLDLTYRGGHEFEIPGAQFVSLFDTTAFAVATKGPKKHFYGVKIAVNDGVLEFVATDSYRLAQKKIPLDCRENFSFIVPVKALALVRKYSDLKSVHVQVDNNLAYFKIDSIAISCRLYVGDFPVIDRIIPTLTPYLLRVDSRSFIGAVSRATIVASDKTQTVRLKCYPEAVEILAKSDNVGTALEPIKGANYQGENFEISFNYGFVLDAVRALSTPEVTLAFAGEGKAFLIKNDDPSVVQIITPIRSGN